MKITRLIQMLTGIAFTCLLLSASCKKNAVNPNVDQLSLLPPATQTGANTFGALVNGVAFIPNYSLYNPAIYSSFGVTNFFITGSFHSSNYITDVGVSMDSLSISSGQNYMLKNNAKGNASGTYYTIDALGNTNTYSTTNTVFGLLTITKLDLVHRIISGTFSFNAINSANDTTKITNGRFDVTF